MQWRLIAGMRRKVARRLDKAEGDWQRGSWRSAGSLYQHNMSAAETARLPAEERREMGGAKGEGRRW
jgi:hypothetical protein